MWGEGAAHEDLRALRGCEQGPATLTSGTTGQGKLLVLGGNGGHQSTSRGRSEADATGPLLTRARLTAQGEGISPGAVLPLLGHLGEDLCEGRGQWSGQMKI